MTLYFSYTFIYINETNIIEETKVVILVFHEYVQFKLGQRCVHKAHYLSVSPFRCVLRVNRPKPYDYRIDSLSPQSVAFFYIFVYTFFKMISTSMENTRTCDWAMTVQHYTETSTAFFACCSEFQTKTTNWV